MHLLGIRCSLCEQCGDGIKKTCCVYFIAVRINMTEKDMMGWRRTCTRENRIVSSCVTGV